MGSKPAKRGKAAPYYRRELPVYPASVVTPGDTPRPLGPEERRAVRQLEALMHTTPGDLQIVGPEDRVLFSCDRSGACCQGRHGLSNLVLPVEAGAMYAALSAAGEMATPEDFCPDLLARVRSGRTPPGGRSGTMIASEARDPYAHHEGEHFMGLAFRMVPDPAMADGDRCQFLVIEPPDGQGAPSGGPARPRFGCRWHGTRAQPMPCALAPLGVTSDPHDDTGFLYYVPRTRYGWCQGTRNALASADDPRPGFTIAERWASIVDGEGRQQELRAYVAAEKATEQWVRGYRNHHSPLAKLYILHCPALERPLVGY